MLLPKRQRVPKLYLKYPTYKASLNILTVFLPHFFFFLPPPYLPFTLVMQFALKLFIMKNILLPTDFTVQSLWPIHNIVKEAGEEKINVIIAHSLHMPSSISDLLFLRHPFDKVPAHFREAYQLLCNRYKSIINKMEFKFIYCSSSPAVNNFLEANHIDAVYILDNYKYGRPLNDSANFCSCLKKCKVPVRNLPLHAEAFSDYQILSALLGNDKPAAKQSPVRAPQSSLSLS